MIAPPAAWEADGGDNVVAFAARSAATAALLEGLEIRERGLGCEGRSGGAPVGARSAAADLARIVKRWGCFFSVVRDLVAGHEFGSA